MPNHRKWTAKQKKAMSVKLQQKYALRKSQPVEEPKLIILAIIDGQLRQLTARTILSSATNENG